MSDQTARLALPYILANQSQKEVTHNEALALLDALVHLTVQDRDLTAPPASPADGACYLVASGGSGAWAGQDGKIAIFSGGAWTFVSVFAGLALWVVDEARLFLRDATSWREMAFAAGAVTVLGAKHAATGKTDADITETTLYTLTLPANTMGLNDTLRVTALWSYPNSSTTKNVKIKVGGSTIFSNSVTTTASLSAQVQISNRSAVNAQIARPTGSASFGTSTSAPLTLTKDFSSAQDVTVTAQWGTAGSGSNSIALESVLVELLRG